MQKEGNLLPPRHKDTKERREKSFLKGGNRGNGAIKAKTFVVLCYLSYLLFNLLFSAFLGVFVSWW
jgi:hypothetical protein